MTRIHGQVGHGFTRWFTLLALAALLLPFKPQSALLAPASVASFADYLRELPQQGYFAIKAMLPWLPLGLLAGMSLSRRMSFYLSPLATLLLLFSLPFLAAASFGDLLASLYATPGLLAGLWLGRHAGNPASVESVVVAAATRGRVLLKPHRDRLPVLPLLFGAIALILALMGCIDFPLNPLALATAFLVYGGLLWFYPQAWLVIVPAALPLFDLAPWSGRFFLDEFDLLLLTTVGVLLWQRPQRHWNAALPEKLFAAFALAALIGSLPALLYLPAIDANAFSSYWSPYNTLRVAKGLLWGWLIYYLIRRGNLPGSPYLLGIGMSMGLFGVCVIGLWEHALYAGTRDYRIFASFSSMHTGGGHIEAYLVAALPLLWLGMTHWRRMLVAIPLSLLATVTLVATVSRGGALALGLELLILTTASLAARRGKWPLVALLLVSLALTAGLSGDYFQKRLANSGEDGQIRADHWQQALAMRDTSLAAELFGMGLGSFPRLYLERGPSTPQPATFGLLQESGQRYLRLGGGETLYYAQRVATTAGENYRLSADVRTTLPEQHLAIPLCERQMLDARACAWPDFALVGDGQWHSYAQALASGEVGAGGPLQHPPVELALYFPGKTGSIDVTNLHLQDVAGHELLRNGDFKLGSDFWFFKTHNHLPWHIKNLWIHLLFEQGWLGLSLFSALLLLALTRLARAAHAGERLAWVLLASLTGLLTVGFFDSLLDTPRLATLLYAFLLLGANLSPPDRVTAV